MVVRHGFGGATRTTALVVSCVAATGMCQFEDAPSAAPHPQRDGGSSRRFLYRVYLNGKFGYIDRTGRIVIEPKYQSALHFHEGLAAVDIAGKTGYIDTQGKVVIPPKFFNAFDFSCGRALATVLRDFKSVAVRYGYIDTSGSWVIPPKYLDGGPFADGLAAVKVGKLWGHIDGKGVTRIRPRFAKAGQFSEGLADVRLRPHSPDGYIDKTGKYVWR